jgi:hypothetical protein
VGRRIVGEVRLGLDDARRAAAVDEDLPEERARDDDRGAGVEGSREGFARPSDREDRN